MPTGLSSTHQPCTSRLSRRCCLGLSRAVNVSVIGLATLVEVASDLWCSQYLLDSFGFGESFVDAKPDFRCEFQVNVPGDFATQIFFVAIERGHNRVQITSAQRHDVNGGEPQ